VKSGDLGASETGERRQRQHGAHVWAGKFESDGEVVVVDRPREPLTEFQPDDRRRRIGGDVAALYGPHVEAVEMRQERA
jgi:hypothetical protein